MKKIKFWLASFAVIAAVQASAQAPYNLPKLNYDVKALEPYIDAQTMEIHHDKHHQAYINNLNKALAGTELEKLTIEQLMLNASRRSEAIRNNAGGHYNHTLFWDILAPAADSKPMEELQKAIDLNFKSMDTLKKLLNQAAMTRFGSGWAWLIVTPEGKLMVTSTANQDNPIMDVSKDRGIPILGIDVWEHAYYLKYQNKRGDYLESIWKIVDWNNVSKRYIEALKDPLLKVIEKNAWKELNEFHMVMSQTFHPIEENNFTPIKERSGEMLAKAIALKNSKIPTSFNTTEIKKAIDELVTGATELHKINTKKVKDEVLKEKMEKLHDKFHEIQGLCSH
jgi:superoxide dismutase